jgi:cyclic pyranopterin phosphate synthase
MPQNPKFLPAKQLLTRQQIADLAKILNSLGIEEIRMTGGEPTMRADFMTIARDLSALPLKKLALTSNGFYLKKYLKDLKSTNCQNINFSMDSLNKTGFYRMTGSHELEKVLESVFMAKELGFKVKVNAVLMRGINEKEITDFVEFSGTYDIEVRFLELMRIGPARNQFEQYFVPADEIINELEKISPLTTISLPRDSTSFNYTLDNKANIGIIASESKPFCGECSRLRLSATGHIRPCLMMDQGFSLKDKTESEVKEILFKTMALKPTDRIYEVNQPMNQIGG